MKLVLIPTKLDSIARELLEAKGIRVVHDPDTPLAELAAAHPDATGLIVRSDRVTPEIIDLLPKLRLIVRAGSGYNTIDIKYARRKGVDVMNTPGANANAVAEEVIALILAHYRHIVRGDITTRAGGWEKKKLMGRELAGKTVGIVGLGNIGQLVAKRLSGFEVRVLGYDPVISQARAAEIGVEFAALDALFAEADIVTLHVPETAETKGMVNRTLLSKMRSGALLVNCARAGIVNEQDLRAVKQEKEIGFCTDVYPADAPGMKSCADIADVMMPHLGASTVEANHNAARRAAEQMIAYAERGVTKYVVNKGVPDDLDESYQQLAFEVARVARSYLGAERPIRQVEASFYGGLDRFAKWLLPPIVAGISTEFDNQQDPEDAQEYLEQMGVSFDVRTTDESKGYGKALTVDLVAGGDAARRASVRGTVAEGTIVISRMGSFDRIYFQPRGHSLIVEYRDRPGVLAKITTACAERDINIEDIRAPRDPSATRALAVLKVDQPIPPEVVAQIKRETDALAACALSLP